MLSMLHMLIINLVSSLFKMLYVQEKLFLILLSLFISVICLAVSHIAFMINYNNKKKHKNEQ